MSEWLGIKECLLELIRIPCVCVCVCVCVHAGMPRTPGISEQSLLLELDLLMCEIDMKGQNGGDLLSLAVWSGW